MSHRWTQESATEELTTLVAEIPSLARQRRFSAPHTRWVARTLRVLEQVFGRGSRYYMSFAALDDLARAGLSGVYEGKDTGPESSALIDILSVVERKLRKVLRQPPSREREVQDALENLLIGADIEYSRETDSIEYSSKTYVPDFSFPRLDLVVEIKLCATQLREKEIIAEINDDILAYRTKYGNQIFVVYDLGHIRDADRFSTQFEETKGVLVRVVKH